MSIFQFPTEFCFEIRGQGKLKSKAERYYNNLASDSNPEVDLVCDVSEIKTENRKILGKPTDYYAESEMNYYRFTQDAEYALSKDFDKIVFSPDTELYKFYKIVEYFARKKAIKKNMALVHASAVEFNGYTIVFPAWRHTGKTNTLLTLLDDYNANYLADDRLWIDSSGEAYAFPMPINLQPYNYNSFPNIDPPSKLYQYRYNIYNRLRDSTHNSNTLPLLALYFFNEHYIWPGEDKVNISDLFPNSEIRCQSEIDAIICLQTSSSNLKMSQIDPESVTRLIRSTSDREWNSGLRKMANAFDSLSDSNIYAEHKNLENKEEKIWHNLGSDIPSFLLQVPREEHWSKKNLSSGLRTELQTILDTL